ncbi:MAG: hypothetical protein WCR89_04390, partial [Bacteroidales bacterium]
EERNSSANGLYRLRKTLAPEKGGDPPQGGEDFPGRYSRSRHYGKGSECLWSAYCYNSLYTCTLAHCL